MADAFQQVHIGPITRRGLTVPRTQYDYANQGVTNNGVQYLVSGIQDSLQEAYIQQLWSKTFAPVQPPVVSTLFNISGDYGVQFNQTIGGITLDLNVSAYQGNESYGGLGYGNYGQMSFQDPLGYYYPVQWINFAKAAMLAPNPAINGFALHLALGVIGNITVFDISGGPDYTYYLCGGQGPYTINPLFDRLDMPVFDV